MTPIPTPFHLQQQQTYPASPSPPTTHVQFPAPPPAYPTPSTPGVYFPQFQQSLQLFFLGAYPTPSTPGVYFPQFQQAQQLFQRDVQTITPEALECVKAALASSEVEHKVEVKKRAIPRKAAGQAWEDPTLAEWP